MQIAARRYWDTFRRKAYHSAHKGAAHHVHNLAYCIYYGMALAEDRGLKLFVVSVIFAVTLLATVASTNLENE
jgi:hypothetical protein